ncbi:protein DETOXIFICATION 43-like [Lycium ferocissimum]|uniref:protein DETOXIFICATION 43-like n=1 Tax=Lycium ferocissimum TaxID=112874 RepID=UPI002815B83B|nr:protein DETOXIFICATION 43-like [Lycium ferocissimum]
MKVILVTNDTNLENVENGASTNIIETIESLPEEGSKSKGKPRRVKRQIPSASTAILMGCINLGLFQTLFLVFLAKPILGIFLSLAMQGVFRGFKDTRTPLYATVAGDLTNIVLDPIFIFVLRWGVSGAAVAHVLSQILVTSKGDTAVTFCTTLSASLAARLRTVPMAAFQVCLQVWLTSSLLSDGLAVAAQAILATSFAEKDYQKAKATGVRVLQMGYVMGHGLALIVGLGLFFGSGVFSQDTNVIRLIIVAIPLLIFPLCSIGSVAGTQPINSLAFVLDGVNFGANDFSYSAFSRVLVGALTIGSELGHLIIATALLRQVFSGPLFVVTERSVIVKQVLKSRCVRASNFCITVVVLVFKSC